MNAASVEGVQSKPHRIIRLALEHVRGDVTGRHLLTLSSSRPDAKVPSVLSNMPIKWYYQDTIIIDEKNTRENLVFKAGYFCLDRNCTMKITFVGHASVFIEEAGIGLLIDPWIKGDAFNESWALYPPAVLNADTLARVTHIWISHEHPDHLSIPTLKSFSPELKSQIVVLFQKHYDTEIVDWLKSQGFRDAKEMPHGNWIPLSPDIEAVCYQIGHMDSALAIRTPRQTILNLNDCDTPLSTLARLRGSWD
jgi:Beta-lactamase superfamily domain